MTGPRVVAIAYERLCVFEFGIATELFGLRRPELERDWYDFQVVSTSHRPIAMLGGAVLDADRDLTAITDADTVILPGWPGPEVEAPAELLQALDTAHRNGARLVSICAGAFVFAAAGLLDGRAATTHWRFCEELAAAYPEIDVRPNVLFTEADRVFTSAGSAAGMDLGLHLIRQDHGAAVAASVARRLVMLPQRDGDQAQYAPSAPPVHPARAQRRDVAEAMEWARRRLGEEITVASMADAANMSSRNFARRFAEEVGRTPLAWIRDQRLDRARVLLESTTLPIDEVARQSGHRTAETLRHHFRQRLDTSPGRYRRTFSVESARSSSPDRSSSDVA
ncbi:MAG: helix-turn-helix domain-containing protein [Actinomycetota bacterium]